MTKHDYQWHTSKDAARADTCTVKLDTHFLELQAFTLLTGEGPAEARFCIFQYVPVDNDHPQGFTWVKTEKKMCKDLADAKKWLRGKARAFQANLEKASKSDD